jgi:hypothetical protein
MSKALTREQILAAPDAGRIRVDVPEWVGHIWVHEMSAHERDGWERSVTKDDDRYTNMRAKLLVHILRDDNGNPLFTPNDVPFLGRQPYALLDRLIEASKKIGAMTTAAGGEA